LLRPEVCCTMGRIRKEIAAVFGLIVLGLFAAHMYLLFYSPLSRSDEKRTIVIKKGTSFRQVALKLRSAGIIGDTDDFLFVAWVMGASRRAQAGEYEFSPSMTPVEIIGKLVHGEIKEYPVTIPEGTSMREIAALLERRGLADGKRFLELAEDHGLVKRLGLPGRTLEGFLFPDTYRFTRGMTEEEIIRKMVARFREVYFPELDEAAKRAGMTMKEVVTLASIIEKETQAPEERLLISAVFHNRLRKGIRLQSDPTVIYAIKDFDGNLRKRDLMLRSPYNTYRHYGLPPGPISNPGVEAMRAAIFPAKGDYLYFVSKNNGTHYFSKSLREHINAVNRYQKGLARAN